MDTCALSLPCMYILSLEVSVSGAAQAIVIFSSRLSCFYTHRKELLLATSSPWVPDPEPGGKAGQVKRAECWSLTGLPQ